MSQRSIETKLVQLGNLSDAKTGAINPPIYMSTAYQHTGIGESTGYDYTRTKIQLVRYSSKGSQSWKTAMPDLHAAQAWQLSNLSCHYLNRTMN